MSGENLEVVRRWWEGFNKHGMPSLDLCDEQIEIANPPEFLVVETEKLIDAGDGQKAIRHTRETRGLSQEEVSPGRDSPDLDFALGIWEEQSFVGHRPADRGGARYTAV